MAKCSPMFCGAEKRNIMNYHLILASASPRRIDLLSQIGLVFEVIPSDIDESKIRDHDHLRNIQLIALCKVQDVARKIKECGSQRGIVIGADTQIIIDGEILGKPIGRADALSMLSKLSARSHQVITGVAILDIEKGSNETWVEETNVYFREISPDEICDYLETGEYIGKAGAYGIQGRAAAFVERIEGCYFNVVGLPLSKLSQKLRKMQKIQDSDKRI